MAASSRRAINIWPGFVDALSTLLLVLIFVLLVFILAQFFLSVALTGRDERLAELDRQIAELADLLALERSSNQDLRASVSQLSAELQASIAARDDLSRRLAVLGDERDALAQRAEAAESAKASLEQQLAAVMESSRGVEDRLTETAQAREEASARARELAARTEDLEAALKQAQATVAADKEKIEAQLSDLAAMRSLRDQLQAELVDLEDALAGARNLLKQREEDLASTRSDLADRQARLTSLLADLERLRQQAASQGQTLEDQEKTLASLRRDLSGSRTAAAEQQKISEEAELRISLLNRQMAALRRQLAALNAALDAAAAKEEASQAQIADLGRRLNVALANKVQELARYRSEFFGRLREAIGDNPNIRVVGDRFVFQAEVLFPSGSATMDGLGREQIDEIAAVLRQVAAQIPDDIDWVLRVDGHTDVRPISTSQFPSNWELSSARAIAVVRQLIDDGIPPNRLVAAGFGQFQPLDPGSSDEAYRRNRRIEFKLTER